MKHFESKIQSEKASKMNISSMIQNTTDTESTITPLLSTYSNVMQNATITNDETTDVSIHVSTLVICTIANVFIMLLSCYGNGKILVTCYQTFKTHSNFRWLKTNLSIGDFVLSLTQCPILMFLLLGMPVLANVLLPLALFCAGLSLTVSINSISGIAIHRYLKLKCNYEIQKKFTSIIIMCSWIFGILMATTFAILISMKMDAVSVKLPDIVVEGAQFKTIAYILITVFLVTLAIVFFAYTAIAKVLISGPSAKSAGRCLAKCTNKVTVTGENENAVLSSIIANKHKAILSCIGIVCVHIICWLPFVLVFTFDRYIEDCNVSLNVKVIAWMLVLFQSALNPYIYQVPKDSSKRLLRKLYCEQCLHFPDKFPRKWPIRGAEQRTGTCEISDHLPIARTSSGIFQIRVPDNENVDKAVGPSQTYKSSSFASA